MLWSSLWCFALPDSSSSHHNAVLVEHFANRAIRITNLFHHPPDCESGFIEPYNPLGIVRRNTLFSQRHTFILEELAEPGPRDTVFQTERPN